MKTFKLLSKEEMELIDIECMRFRDNKIKELIAVKSYKDRVGMEPCCAKQALEGTCLCWQDRW